MRPLFTSDELIPGASVPRLAERFAVFDDGMPVSEAACLRVVNASVAGRLWELASLVAPGWYRPDQRWCAETLLDEYIEEMPAFEIASSLARMPVCREDPVFVADDLANATVLASWGFYLDRVATLPSASVVAPPDASWVLIKHYDESIAAYQTGVARIRSVAFTPHFPRRDGTLAAKRQYLIRFDDGTHWLSGDLRYKSRCGYDGLLRTIADRAGLEIETLEALPEELARPRRSDQ